MSEKTSVERRRDRRHPCLLRLVLIRAGQEFHAQTEDVSFAGIFVRLEAPLPERQLVRLRLILPPGGDELAVMGMVARHLPASGDLPPGVGIQFYSLAAGERRRWNEFIRFITEGPPGTKPPGMTLPRSPPRTRAASPPVAAPAPAPSPAAPPAPEAVAPEAAAQRAAPPDLPAAGSPAAPSRRRFPRYAAALQVRLESVGDLQQLYTRNISQGGLFFGTTLDLPEGAPLKVSVIHPKTHEHFALEATVRWRTTSPDPGLGLEFVGMDDARREGFLEFLSSEIPVEEVLYVAAGDPHLVRFVPPG